MRKDKIDLLGGAALVSVSALLGLNQVLVKIVNVGLSPMFQAGARSVISTLALLIFCWLWRRPLNLRAFPVWLGLFAGTLFGAEFVLLFLALDYSSVGRVSVLFYTMPVFLTIAAHFILPGERLTPLRSLGLVLAVAGVAVAMSDRGALNQGGLVGDIMALIAAAMWAMIALMARVSSFSRANPETQLFWQVAVSGVLLVPLALLVDVPIRDPDWSHLAILLFQGVVISCGAFLTWFFVLSIYPASDMASFGFWRRCSVCCSAGWCWGRR